MKRICAFLATAVLCLSVITISYAAAPSFAATKWCTPPTGFGGGSRVIPTDTIVSYSNLRDYRTAVNKWLSEGQYSGFHGTASLTYTGSFYFIQLVQDGNVYWLCNGSGGRYRTEVESSTDDSATTTVPSTTAPSIDKTESTETDHTYISDPSTPSNSLDELDALNRLIRFTVTQIKSIQGVWRTNINMYNIQIKMRSLMRNMIDGINNVTDGIYEQVDLLAGYLPRLDDIYNRLFNIQSASWASVDVENRIYSSVTGLGSRLDSLVTNSTGTNSRLDTLITRSAGIGSRLDSIINNGAVQVNTTSLEARLDKLISMYSKVNSVVLDTAAINGNKIKAAVGGELEDAIFWGVSSFSDKKFIVSDGTFTLNGVQYQIPVQPLGFTTGASVPASFDTADTALMAGVWRTSGGSYCLSDTYNAATGEYVRRVGVVTYDGSEDWKMVVKDGCYLFYLSDPAFSHTNGNIFSMTSQFGYVPYNSAFSGNASDSAIAYNYKCTVFTGKIMVINQSPSVAAWKTWLKQQADAGTPWTVWYQDKPTTTVLDRTTIAIPEGDGIITGDYMRITGKYETYDSYTQTADIIAAINNIPPYDDSGLIAAITGMTTPTVTTDLTEVTSRLDLILGELQSSSGSATCEHTYAQHMEQEADCTLPGLMISTCSKCGDSYSEIVDPLGHDWVVSSHVDAVTDPDTGEETASAYDVYTCSRCERTYEDHTGDGAPDEDYSSTSISQLVVQVFSKLGTFAGKLIGFFVHLLDKALTSVDNVISKFNDYTTQISGFGGSYTTWLTGFWGIIPAELQIALTFSVICMALGAVGKKLLFS